jgi:hypothetical protein
MSNRNRDSIAIEESRIALLQTDSMWPNPGFAMSNPLAAQGESGLPVLQGAAITKQNP